MSLFVTLADYRQKPSPKTNQTDGSGSFASKNPSATGGNVEEDKRSQIGLAATRIAKFIPSTIILGYVGACNLVNSKDPVHDTIPRLIAFKIIFWVCLVLTPIYILSFDWKNPLRWLNVIVGLIAFPIWAYAFPCGWFVEIHLYDPVWAGVALLLFSMITGVIPAPKLDGG